MNCKSYVGLACVDGTCPKANQEYLDFEITCENFYCNKGCEDCALFGTEYCELNDKNEIEKG